MYNFLPGRQESNFVFIALTKQGIQLIQKLTTKITTKTTKKLVKNIRINIGGY